MKALATDGKRMPVARVARQSPDTWTSTRSEFAAAGTATVSVMVPAPARAAASPRPPAARAEPRMTRRPPGRGVILWLMLTDTDMRHLRRCVELATAALGAGDEPFGSVLVGADGTVLGEDHNHVAGGDRTQHPEFALARWAAENLTPEARAAATVYTSGEHCPMCAAAHGWVGLGRIVYVELQRAAGRVAVGSRRPCPARAHAADPGDRPRRSRRGPGGRARRAGSRAAPALLR